MLSILKTLTKNGRRAIYKSSVWLAIFQIVAMLPLILIYQTNSKMFAAGTNGNKIDFSYLVIFGIGTLLVLALYFAYRKMYKEKYLSASKENLTLRMGVADKLRRLPESFLSKHDLIKGTDWSY